VLNGAAQVFATATSPFVSYFSFRTIIIGGFLLMSLFMIIIAGFATVERNNLLVVSMMFFLATF